MSLAKAGRGHYLQRAIRKHGKKSFRIETLATFENREALLRAEMALIANLHATDKHRGYNITAGGDGTVGFTKPGLVIDMVGKRYGRLLVIESAKGPYEVKSRERKAYWSCVCDCGRKVTKPGKLLRNGHTQSCGCLRSELATTEWCVRARAAKVGSNA